MWAGDAARMAAAEAWSLAQAAAELGWEAVLAELQTRWDQLVLLANYGVQLPLSPLFAVHVMHQRERAERFGRSQEGCTPASEPAPPAPADRRIAVVVAGFGSSSEEAGVRRVDLAGLGYEPADVAQFSYAGGRVPGFGELDGVPTGDYGPGDANGDLRESGARLEALLDNIGAAHPGVPIDVIAHSQGGVVALLALVDRPPGAPAVGNLITLGSPHHGADIATANALVGTTTVGGLAQAGSGVIDGGSLDGSSAAAAQLSETSAVLHDLDAGALPPGTRVTSIAARGDLTVTALHSSLEGATNAMVPLDGLWAHTDLPGSELAEREMALALAGLGPTCRALAGDVARATAISLGEDALGLAAGLGSMWLDSKLPRFDAPRRPPGPVPGRRPAGELVPAGSR